MKVYEDERRIAALIGAGYEKEPEIELSYTFQAKRDVATPPAFALHTLRVGDLARPPQGKAAQPAPVVDVEQLDDRTWRWARRVPADTARVRVETTWSDAAGAQHATDVLTLLATTPLNSKKPSPVLVGLDAPRLVMALNEAPVPAASSPPTLDFGRPGEAELVHLLEHIWTRLQGGLGAAWRHAYLRAGRPIPDETALDDEERWARGITEALCGITYTTPGVVHSNFPRGGGKGGQKNPKDIVDAALKHTDADVLYFLQEGDDPCIPVVTECQHTCTTAAITRGHRFPLAPEKPGALPKLLDWKMMTASSNETAFGAITPKGSWAKLTDASTRDEFADVVRPGSVYGFRSKEEGIQGAGSHVAFIVRVLSRDAQGRPSNVQFLDSGGVFGEGPTSLPALVNPETFTNPPKIYDMFASTLDTRSVRKKNFAGVGTFADDPAVLRRGVERLGRARPVGFARLVVTRRTEDERKLPLKKFEAARQAEWLVYASPWLRMWTSRAEQNFHVSRLVWALRDHPGREQLRVSWLIDVPRGHLFRAVVSGGRARSARAIAGAGCIGTDPELNFHYLPLMTYSSRRDGRVSGEGYYRGTHEGGTKTSETPAGRPKAWDAWPVLQPQLGAGIDAGVLDRLPAYFRDEVP